MGLFDRDKKDEKKKEEKKKADFSNVESGSSSIAKPEAVSAKTYTVKSGDSLWAISERLYGNGNEWNRIYEANRDTIKDPDLIQPGWVLNIPAYAGTEGEGK